MRLKGQHLVRPTSGTSHQVKTRPRLSEVLLYEIVANPPAADRARKFDQSRFTDGHLRFVALEFFRRLGFEREPGTMGRLLTVATREPDLLSIRSCSHTHSGRNGSDWLVPGRMHPDPTAGTPSPTLGTGARVASAKIDG